jgi:transposase
MPKAYSNDLRCKLLTAYDRGQGSLRALSELFSVSYDWAKKISSQRLRSQQMERVPQSRHGTVSRVTPAVEAELLRLLREQPDRTLAELQNGLRQALGVGMFSSMTSFTHCLWRSFTLPRKRQFVRRWRSDAVEADGSPGAAC